MTLKLIVDNEKNSDNTFEDALKACEIVKTRNERIEDFIDHNRPVMQRYYELKDNYPDKYENLEEYDNQLSQLIALDKYFFDTYIDLFDSLLHLIKNIEQQSVKKSLIKQKYTFILELYSLICDLICDCNGQFPKNMSWFIIENRHILRALDTVAKFCWDNNMLSFAYQLYKKIFLMNLDDNLGIRYHLVALNMGLDSDYCKMFVFDTGQFQGIDEDELEEWFEKNKVNYLDDFKEYDDYINVMK